RRRTPAGVDPSARRTPISRVRSATPPATRAYSPTMKSIPPARSTTERASWITTSAPRVDRPRLRVDGARVGDLGRAHLPISKAVDQVIVHHPHRLHVGVNDGGAHEAESALLQVLAERIGFGRAGGNLLRGFPAVHFGLPA